MSNATAMCAVCRRRPLATSVLCDPCQEKLIGGETVAPEQIVAKIERPTVAALVDRWGRPHRLELETHVGRIVDGPTLLVLSSTISRHQASIDREEGQWILRDLRSTNGTVVDHVAATKPIALRDGARVRFGEIGFYFLADVTGVSTAKLSRDIGETIRASSESEASRATRDCMLPPREFVVELHQPAGGGGGVVSINGIQVQVRVAQLELIALLDARMRADAGGPPVASGYVTVDELLGKLSFESSDANEDNVRQLVRRVRRLLARYDLGDLIESRPGRGYRLRVRPGPPGGTARR